MKSGLAVALVAAVSLCGCVPQRSVGGALTGLDPSLGSVAVTLNGGQPLVLSADGAFKFPQQLPEGSTYRVEISAAPERQDCAVTSGSGTVAPGADITSVAILCRLKRYSIGGRLGGIDKAGLTLVEQTSSQTLSPDAGALGFEFGQPLEYRQSYQVSISATPEGRDCAIDGGAGTVDGGVNSIFVGCEPQRFPLSGTISGLTAGTLTLSESATAQQLLADAGSSQFQFGKPIDWGTSVQVGITAQPSAEFCRIDGGSGNVRAPKGDVAVSCKPGSSVGGFAYGVETPGLVLREGTTAQTLGLVPDGGVVDFTFPGAVPNGEAYAVTVDAAPAGQVCRVENGTGTVSGAIHTVAVVCSYGYPDLVISELSGTTQAFVPAWVELFNGTSTPKNLADYVLRADTIFSDGGVSLQTDFALPDASVPAFGFFVLSGKPFADLYDGPQLRLVGTQSASMYFAGDGGSSGVQLLKAGVAVDAVLFTGASDAGWQGTPIALPTDLGRVLARRVTRADTDRAADFSIAEVATPGGPNDAFDGTDLDNDGIPDTAERPGGMLAGLPLYDWGARTGVRDVFVEIDWMRPDGGGNFDPGILPRKDAIDRVTQVLAGHGIVLHTDLGKLNHPGAGIDPLALDLGGGNEVPFGCTLTLSGTVGPTSFYALKAQHFDLRRRASFHYAVFGNSLADVVCGGQGATGRSDLPGNDVAITLGNRGYALAPTTQLNRLVNVMSATLLHELGHNFGLHHGGADDTNFKPNYLSVMNYLYQLEGLPQLGNVEGDRYYYLYGGLYGLCTGAPAIASHNSLTQNVFSAPSSFALDFSDGGSAPLDLAALDETKGMGRIGSGSVDWNYDGTIQTTPVTASIDALGTAAPVCPRGNPATGVISDHDDWSAISLPFQHSLLGSATGAKRSSKAPAAIDLIGDHQLQADESPLPP